MTVASATSPIQTFEKIKGHQFRAAQFGASQLIHDARLSKIPNAAKKDISEAVDLMFAAHMDQERQPGVPYVNHTLLVARVLVKKFGITQPEAVIAALLHDAPEDQAKRISKLLTGKESDSPLEAIDAICKIFPARAKLVRSYLGGLTNPDFDALAAALKDDSPAPAQRLEAEHLLSLAKSAGGKSLGTGALDTKAIKNLLYLGHWVELRKGDPITFAIKLADFFTNGMHRHLLLKDVSEMALDNPNRGKMIEKAAKLGKKYEPVIDYLVSLFESNSSTPIISKKVDSFLHKKLLAAKEFSADADLDTGKLEILGLLEDLSYEGAEKLRKALNGLDSSDTGRKAKLSKLFGAPEMAQKLKTLEKNFRDSVNNFRGYEKYMEGVNERIDRFASMFPGGEESWGFQNGADFEDVIDKRNYQRDIGERNKSANAASMRLLALYGTYKYGDAYLTEPKDAYLKEIQKLW